MEYKQIDEKTIIFENGEIYVKKEPHDAHGYKATYLHGKKHLVHRLVAKFFISNPNQYEEVNHKDRNKSNNHIDNLEWVTHQQNIQHYHDDNRNKILNFRECDLLIDGEVHKTFGSVKEACRYAQSIGYAPSQLEKKRVCRNATLIVK